MISILNNSLKGFTFNPSEPRRKMQQGNDLLSICFINDFQWKHEQNKGKQNKGRRLVLPCETIHLNMCNSHSCHERDN
jgi:hypothetical protein